MIAAMGTMINYSFFYYTYSYMGGIISVRVCGGPVVWLLVCSQHSLAAGKQMWRCSGEPTTYTYTDCETDKSLTDGCYYLVHFEQYRPCNDICNGVEMWSIDEERCRSYCPAYLSTFCSAQAQDTRTKPIKDKLAATTKKWHKTTVGCRMTSQAPKRARHSVFLVLGVVSGVLAVAVTIITVFVFIFIRRRKSFKRSPKDLEDIALQPSTDESYQKSFECHSWSDKLVDPVEASSDNEQNKKKEMSAVSEE